MALKKYLLLLLGLCLVSVGVGLLVTTSHIDLKSPNYAAREVEKSDHDEDRDTGKPLLIAETHVLEDLIEVPEAVDSRSELRAPEITAPVGDSRLTVEDFMHRGNKPPFISTHIEQNLSPEDLPYLYASLEDNKFALQWTNALFAICVLEEDDVALEVVKQFVATPWNWQESGFSAQTAYQVIGGRLMSIRNAAMLDPDLSGPFLTPLLSEEAATEFLREWRGVSLPMEESTSKRVFFENFQFGVASGLLHTRSPELFDHVENTFQMVASRNNPQTYVDDVRLLASYATVMGVRDIVLIRGWEDGIMYLHHLDLETKVRLSDAAIRKYMELAIE